MRILMDTPICNDANTPLILGFVRRVCPYRKSVVRLMDYLFVSLKEEAAHGTF